MDFYVTSNNFRDAVLVDDFASVIWTERYSAFGDFTLEVPEATYFRNLKAMKYFLCSESKHVMMIEDVVKSNQTQRDDVNMVTVKGRTIDAFLKYRNSKMFKTSASGKPESFTGSPGEVARWVVNKYCIDPATAGAANVVPRLKVSNYTAGGTREKMAIDRGDIYSIVKSLCDSDELGFKIERNEEDLWFNLYRGEDKSNPTAANFKVYTPDDDSLIDITTRESITGFVNNVRAIGAKTYVDVYAAGYSASTSGLDRRTLVVEYSDIGSGKDDEATSIAEDQAELRQKAREVLANPSNKYAKLIEGDIPPASFTKANFKLGDVVLVRDTDGGLVKSRITEHIRSVDATGKRNIPTFEGII